MFFTTEAVEQLDQNLADVLSELQDHQLQVVTQGQPLEATSRVRELENEKVECIKNWSWKKPNPSIHRTLRVRAVQNR